MEGGNAKVGDMSKFLKFTLLMILAFTFLGASCGDGSHKSRAPWNMGQGVSDDVNADLSDATLECIDVIGYRKFKATEQEVTSETVQGENGEEMTAVDAMYQLTGIDAISAMNSATNAIRSCIKKEIASMRASGSEFYIGNVTWIATRNKLAKQPLDKEMTIVEFIDCDQIQSASCLLYD